MSPFIKHIDRADSVAEVKTLIDEAVALAKTARRKEDLRLLRHAVEMQRRAERRGGQLLGKRSHPNVDKHQVARWRAAAETSDEVFEAALKRTIARQSIGVSSGTNWRIKMRLSDWFLDDAGFPTRVLTAVDVPAVGETSRGST